MRTPAQPLKSASSQSVTNITCPLCKNQRVDFYTKKDGYDFWRSKDCGLIFLDPLPDPSSANVYSQDYFFGAQEGFGYVDYDQDKSVLAYLFKKFLALMALQNKDRGQLLDIGAATGYFIALANQEGWSAQGIDISHYAAEEARKKGLNVEAATLDSFEAPQEAFSAITMWDVLEHLPNPKTAIKKIHDLLKAGGLLAINTPDGESLWARMVRGKWQALVPPEHMIIFSKKSLKILLEEYGFEILAISNPIKKFTPAYILKVFSHSAKLPIPSKLIEMLNRKPFNGMAIPIPICDNVFVLARKR